MVRCWAAATVTTEAVACFPRQHVPRRLHHHTRLSQRKANVSVSLWLSKGERTHCSPQFLLQPRACRACLLQKAPTRQQRLDVAKTVKPVGQQGSSLTSNPPKHQAPKATQCPRVHPLPPPREPSRSFFPDIFLQTRRPLAFFPRTLTLYLPPAPPAPESSLALPPCTCTVLDRVCLRFLLAIPPPTYLSWSEPCGISIDGFFGPSHPDHLCLLPPDLCSFASGRHLSQPCLLRTTTCRCRAQMAMVSRASFSPCSTRHPVVLFPPSWHPTRDGTS